MALIKERKTIDPLDRNKTDLTHKLTALAEGHLTVLGCKPIETEVPVGGFIVDVAGFTYPTMSEMKRGKLLKRIIMEQPELNEVNGSNKYYYAADLVAHKHMYPLTAVVEVKVSMADFRKDLDRKFNTSLANLNYLIVPKSIHDKVRDTLHAEKSWWTGTRWSLLMASDSGERLLRSDPPYICSIGTSETIEVISQIAIRRCHRTRYRFMRDSMKQYRAERAEWREKRGTNNY